MTNDTNIYDIDGNIIRKAGDNHHFTIDELKEKVQKYQQKLQEIHAKESPTPDDLKKAKIYENYCTNLMNSEWDLISKMSQNEFTEYMQANMPENPTNTTKEEVKEALKTLENDIETGENTENEIPGSTTINNEDSTNEELGDDEVIEWDDSNIHEARSVSQSDLLVEREGVNDSMDEYVDYEEI